MNTRRRAQPQAMQSFHDPKDIELIAKLQFALTEALDQNEILRNRVIELEALLIVAQQMNEQTKPRSAEKPRRKQPSRKVKNQGVKKKQNEKVNFI